MPAAAKVPAGAIQAAADAAAAKPMPPVSGAAGAAKNAPPVSGTDAAKKSPQVAAAFVFYALPGHSEADLAGCPVCRIHVSRNLKF